jgi:hypothetical protein
MVSGLATAKPAIPDANLRDVNNVGCNRGGRSTEFPADASGGAGPATMDELLSNYWNFVILDKIILASMVFGFVWFIWPTLVLSFVVLVVGDISDDEKI